MWETKHVFLCSFIKEVSSDCPRCLCYPWCSVISVYCRKVCKHCLHTRDDHDIKDEENLRSVTVGKILFAPDVTFSGSPASSPALPRAKCVLYACM